jgi:ubiquinone/menaquinone biosynthesis C-methylase UbiE
MFYKGEKLEGPVSSHSDLQGLGPQVRKELAGRLPRGDVRALDIGTGSAGNAEFLARSLAGKSRIWTLDPSKEVLVTAKKSLAAKGLTSRMGFVQASASETGLKSRYFGCVVSVMTLHHIEDLRPAIKEMLRVLKVDGKILLADYRPEAADEFHFEFRHEKSDFLTSTLVADLLKGMGAEVTTNDFDLWYLVEATKTAGERRMSRRAL